MVRIRRLYNGNGWWKLMHAEELPFVQANEPKRLARINNFTWFLTIYTAIKCYKISNGHSIQFEQNPYDTERYSLETDYKIVWFHKSIHIYVACCQLNFSPKIYFVFQCELCAEMRWQISVHSIYSKKDEEKPKCINCWRVAVESLNVRWFDDNLHKMK